MPTFLFLGETFTNLCMCCICICKHDLSVRQPIVQVYCPRQCGNVTPKVKVGQMADSLNLWVESTFSTPQRSFEGTSAVRMHKGVAAKIKLQYATQRLHCTANRENPVSFVLISIVHAFKNATLLHQGTRKTVCTLSSVWYGRVSSYAFVL